MMFIEVHKGLIQAVIFVHQIFECNRPPSRVLFEVVGIKVVTYGDKPRMEQWKSLFDVIAGFDAVPSKPTLGLPQLILRKILLKCYFFLLLHFSMSTRIPVTVNNPAKIKIIIIRSS